MPREAHSGRLVVLSNRVALPDPDTGKVSAGGLAVGVRGALASNGGGVWIGWNGKTIPDSEAATRTPQSSRHEGIEYITIPLTKSEIRNFYEKTANESFWPVMHEIGDHSTDQLESYDIYEHVNSLFANILSSVMGPSDRAWVHDYHFPLVGKKLREQGVSNRIDFFSHIPTPSRAYLDGPSVSTPLRTKFMEAMNALTAYDRVCFQTTRDLRNYLNLIDRRGVNLPPRFNTVSLRGDQKTTEFGAFPISIESTDIPDIAAETIKSLRVQQLLQIKGDRKLIIGADRLDPTKGIPHRIDGIKKFIDKYPNYQNKFISLQITPRSRAGIPAYEANRELVRNLIMETNDQGTECWKPIHYTEKNVPRDILLGEYRAADICMVTTLRDGMHLGIKEAIAAQDPEDPAAFILSEHAGAAEELEGHGVILINPYDPEEIADALHEAMTMPLWERQARYDSLMQILRQNDVRHWAQQCLKPLENHI